MANILVVDDELGIRALLSEILSDEGHTIELAENAAQARASRERERPDLVLLDIWMPDVDGVTLLKEWGASGLLTMPVIMMSGHGTIDTAVEAVKVGAMAFLEKPITLQKLLPLLAEGASVIVNTSIADARGTAGLSIYSASKGAVAALVRCLAVELAPRKIRVNSVSPAIIATPIQAKFGLPPEVAQASAQYYSSRIPLGRFGAAEEVAEAVLFVATLPARVSIPELVIKPTAQMYW